MRLKEQGCQDKHNVRFLANFPHRKLKIMPVTLPKIPEDILDNPTNLDKAAALILKQKINV